MKLLPFVVIQYPKYHILYPVLVFYTNNLFSTLMSIFLNVTKSRRISGDIIKDIPPFWTILWNSKGGYPYFILFVLVFLNKFFGYSKIFTFEGGILKGGYP